MFTEEEIDGLLKRKIILNDKNTLRGCDQKLVDMIDEFCHAINDCQSSYLRDDLKKCLLKIREHYNLMDDQHHFATMPKENYSE